MRGKFKRVISAGEKENIERLFLTPGDLQRGWTVTIGRSLQVPVSAQPERRASHV